VGVDKGALRAVHGNRHVVRLLHAEHDDVQVIVEREPGLVDDVEKRMG